MSMEAILKMMDQIHRISESNDHSQRVSSVVNGIMAQGAQMSRERMQLMNQIISDERQLRSFNQQFALQKSGQDFIQKENELKREQHQEDQYKQEIKTAANDINTVLKVPTALYLAAQTDYNEMNKIVNAASPESIKALSKVYTEAQNIYKTIQENGRLVDEWSQKLGQYGIAMTQDELKGAPNAVISEIAGKLAAKSSIPSVRALQSRLDTNFSNAAARMSQATGQRSATVLKMKKGNFAAVAAKIAAGDSLDTIKQKMLQAFTDDVSGSKSSLQNAKKAVYGKWRDMNPDVYNHLVDKSRANSEIRDLDLKFALNDILQVSNQLVQSGRLTREQVNDYVEAEYNKLFNENKQLVGRLDLDSVINGLNMLVNNNKTESDFDIKKLEELMGQ